MLESWRATADSDKWSCLARQCYNKTALKDGIDEAILGVLYVMTYDF